MASRVGAQINSFALIMVASRALDLAEFGSYAIAWAFSVIFTTLVYTGVYHVFLRAKHEDRVADTILWLQVGMGAVGFVVMASLGAIGQVFGGETTGLALILLAPVPLIASFGAWNEAQLVRRGRIRTTSLSVLAAEIVALLVALGMFRAGFGIEALIASRYGSTLFTAFLLSAIVRRCPKLQFRRGVAKRSISQAWPLWGSASLGMSSNYGADLILGAFLNPTAVGAYRAGSRVANTAADVVLQPLGTLSWARFARLEAGNAQREIADIWKQNMALGFALIAPVMVSISLLSAPLVEVLFDPSWGAVSGIVAILALARTLDSLTFLLEPTMTCLGRTKVQFYVSLFSVLLLIGLLLSVGRFSVEAAIFAVLAKGIIVATISVTLMLRATRIPFAEFTHALTPGLALTALCVGVIYLLDPARGALLPWQGLVLTMTALAVLWIGVVGTMLRRRVLVLPTP